MSEATRRIRWSVARRLALAVALVASRADHAGAQAGSPASGTGQTPVHRGFAVVADVSMRIYVPAGRVRVRAWDRDSIDVRGTVGPTASVFGGGSRTGVKFGIESKTPGDNAMPEAEVTVTVPRKARLWVKTTAASIDAEGTDGELELYAVSGSIVVRGASGVVSVESIDASVEIVSSRGDLRVRGGKAPLIVRDVTGTASLATVSGRVTLLGASVPECRVETIGGDIDVQAPLRGATLELQSHSGAISIVVDAKRLPELDLASRSGVVTWNRKSGSAAAGRIVARSFKGAITVK